jgi:Fe2+ or Zn2+ uptake regulation protein
MATPAYRNSPEPKRKTLAPCRNSVRSQTSETLSLMRESLSPQTIKQVRFTSAHQVAETLDQLCEMGLVEKFVDEYRVTRYRPTNGRMA